MPTLRELSDIADYLSKQLVLMAKGKTCSQCGNKLERVYYRIPGIPGKFCERCVHKIYRDYGITFFARTEEDDEAEAKNLD